MNLLLPLLIPVVGAGAIWLLRDQGRARDGVAIATGIAQIVAVAALLPSVLDGTGLIFQLTPFLPEAPIA
ncbi:MAG: hypothetical protein M3161_06250, partial [Actinomycetota bacterium]|nr:hypothetical protein [Actinomycetota bacterium]